MKNIFKVMGVALLACSMVMVSCKKDDENDNNVTEGIVINMDGENWTPVDFYGQDYPAGTTQSGTPYDAFIAVEMYKTTAADSPYLEGTLQAAVCSGATYQSTAGDIIEYRDENDIFQYQGQNYWNFIADQNSFVENVTAVDLNACKMSANWTENYNSAEGYVATQTFPKVMNGTITNATWTVAQGK